MRQRLILVDDAVRQSLKDCFEKHEHDWTPDSVRFLARLGVEEYATAGAVLRHLAAGRKLYAKWTDDGSKLLDRQCHGEIQLFEDGTTCIYMHFTLAIEFNRVRVRAHVNSYPASLPW